MILKYHNNILRCQNFLTSRMIMNLSKIFDKIVCVVGCYWDCLVWPAGIDVIPTDVQAVAVVIILLE